jgi:hypothetical protein
MKRYKSVVCKDGFTMSVQAGPGLMSSRRFDDSTPLRTVEVGFPSEKEDLLMAYFPQDPQDLTETVYGWVPVRVVAAICLNHGGVAGGELPTEVWLSLIRGAIW